MTRTELQGPQLRASGAPGRPLGVGGRRSPRATADGGGAGTGGSTVLAGLGTKKAAAVAVAAMVVVGAGAGAVYFYRQTRTATDLNDVPEGVDAVAYTDVDRVRNDEALRQVLDKLLALNEGGPEDYEDLKDAFSDGTGLALGKLHSVTTFSKYPDPEDPPETPYSGTILNSDWATGDFVDAYEKQSVYDVSYEQGEYGGLTVYRPTGDVPESATVPWIGVLGNGRFVLGPRTVVEDVVEVHTGDREPVGGELEEAFHSARGGYVKFASRVPSERIPADSSGTGGLVNPDPYRHVELVAGAYYTRGNKLGLEATMYAHNETAAKDVADYTDGLVSLASSIVEEKNLEQSLENVTVEREGRRVVVRVEDTVENITAVLETVEEETGSSVLAATGVASWRAGGGHLLDGTDAAARTVRPGRVEP